MGRSPDPRSREAAPARPPIPLTAGPPVSRPARSPPIADPAPCRSRARWSAGGRWGLWGGPPLGFVAVLRAGWVAFLELRVAELCQGTGSGQTVGAVEVGEAVAQIAGEIERPAALGDRERIGDSIGTVSEQRRGFLRRSQVELAVGAPHVVRAVERGAVPDRHQHV